jgi:hypothetical protein
VKPVGGYNNGFGNTQLLPVVAACPIQSPPFSRQHLQIVRNLHGPCVWTSAGPSSFSKQEVPDQHRIDP